MLRRLLFAESKVSQALEMVPQGSVKAKEKILGPSAPKASGGPTD